jgi:hypothetical protein
MAMSAPSFQLFDDLHQELSTDPALIKLVTSVQANAKGEQWQVVDNLITVHEATKKALHHVCADFFIPGVRTAVRDFVRACITCQCYKRKQFHPAGLLQPLDMPTTVWADIAMDFVEVLPRVNGNSVILIVIDRFCKACHLLPLGHLYTATFFAHLFFNNIVKLHSIPSSIVRERDPVFTGHFWQELFRLAWVKLQHPLAFHPQSNGQSEAANKIIVMYLRCLVGDHPCSWLQWLHWAEFFLQFIVSGLAQDIAISCGLMAMTLDLYRHTL